MAQLEISAGEALYYEYEPPTSKEATFVFVNSLTGSTLLWSNTICPPLQAAGYGTLCFNTRGQAHTEFADDTELTSGLVIDDIKRLLAALSPPSPIFVGLSIGGMFATHAYLNGTKAIGLVLINTLRKPSLRLDWINRANARLNEFGGRRLAVAAILPVIAPPDQLAHQYDAVFSDTPYEAPDQNDGLVRLVKGALAADWDLAYEKLDLPVLVLTGEHDRLFRIDADIAELKTRIADVEEKRYPDAGHVIPADTPETLCGDLLEFAARIHQ